ncbi:unnamed protein product [Cylicocyclus nassatus]|uniref:Uncharacterized protein n=1 Tax=Cylicocyclus nassatus TaxID=53992 RepID=A0AA36DW70_CYLNA|nr:unnamed protein product [Cylicocyclus nassatus]
MELRKEVKKKQGSSEDYVMNALATRLPEFDQNPNPNTDTIHFLMKLMELWKSCREPIAELTKQESNEEYKDYLELQNHIQMIDKAKVPQGSVCGGKVHDYLVPISNIASEVLTRAGFGLACRGVATLCGIPRIRVTKFRMCTAAHSNNRPMQ